MIFIKRGSTFKCPGCGETAFTAWDDIYKGEPMDGACITPNQGHEKGDLLECKKCGAKLEIRESAGWGNE